MIIETLLFNSINIVGSTPRSWYSLISFISLLKHKFEIEQLKKLKKKFDIIFNLDIKNKKYFFSGSISNLCFSSEITDIKLYQERGVEPTLFIELNNNVTIIIQENCEMEIDLYSKSPIIKNRIILYNRDGVYMGYIREI